jgi:hypothetical protein
MGGLLGGKLPSTKARTMACPLCHHDGVPIPRDNKQFRMSCSDNRIIRRGSMKASSVLITGFETLTLKGRGKVRDIYDLGDSLLIVATDRISAFDVVMPNPIPDKGRVLTQLSKFWFDLTSEIVPNHVISAEVKDFPKECQP